MTNTPFDLLKKSPKRRALEWLAVFGAVLLIGAAVFGVKAASDYWNGVKAMQTSAAEDRAAVTEQARIAQQSAADAAQSAQSAQDAVDSKVAEEEAAKASAEAAVAAEAAANAAKPNAGKSSGSSSHTCPSGTAMVEGDESGATGCLPDYCMGALPDPVPPECSVIIRP